MKKSIVTFLLSTVYHLQQALAQYELTESRKVTQTIGKLFGQLIAYSIIAGIVWLIIKPLFKPKKTDSQPDKDKNENNTITNEAESILNKDITEASNKIAIDTEISQHKENKNLETQTVKKEGNTIWKTLRIYLIIFVPLILLAYYFANKDTVKQKENTVSEINTVQDNANSKVGNALNKDNFISESITNKTIRTAGKWERNIYKDKYYKFRVEFPKGWEYDFGSSDESLARALNRESAAVIVVTVADLMSQPDNPDNIFETQSMEGLNNYFNKLLASQNTSTNDLKIEKGFLGNFPAYISSFTSLASSGTQSLKFLSKSVICLHNTDIYLITLNIPVDYYNNIIERDYQRTINSFRFEIK